jgi:hypothetical protein
MSNVYFAETDIWRVPVAAIADSLAEMAIDGRSGNEGIVLWLGRDHEEVAEVTHLVRLRGPLVQKYPDQINIDQALFNDVADLTIEQQVRLIGQVHSHGFGYSLDLSPTDREYGIQTPGYLSLVAPDYGTQRAPIHSWGIHVFADSCYRRLSKDEAVRRIQVTEGPQIPFLTVGGSHEL